MKGKNNPSSIKRNQSIDLVKIFAMFGVMALHSTIDETNTTVGFILSRIAGISVPPQIRNRPHKMTQRSKR